MATTVWERHKAARGPQLSARDYPCDISPARSPSSVVPRRITVHPTPTPNNRPTTSNLDLFFPHLLEPSEGSWDFLENYTGPFSRPSKAGTKSDASSSYKNTEELLASLDGTVGGEAVHILDRFDDKSFASGTGDSEFQAAIARPRDKQEDYARGYGAIHSKESEPLHDDSARKAQFTRYVKEALGFLQSLSDRAVEVAEREPPGPDEADGLARDLLKFNSYISRIYNFIRREIKVGILRFAPHLRDSLSAELYELVTEGEQYGPRKLQPYIDSLLNRHDVPLRKPSLSASEELSATRSVTEFAFVVEPPAPLEAECSKTNITISRDQTAFSNFKKDLLLIFRKSKLPIFGEGSTAWESAIHFEGPKLVVVKPPRAIPSGPLPSHRSGSIELPPPNPFLVSTDRSEFKTNKRLASPQMSNRPAVQELSNSQPPPTTHRAGNLDVKVENEEEGCVGLSQATNPNLLPMSLNKDLTVDQLLDRIARLQAENATLKDSQDGDIRTEVIYFISPGSNKKEFSTAYLDEPTWSVGSRGEIALKAHFPIPDVAGYIKQQNDVAFMIAKFYDPSQQEKEVQMAARRKVKLPQPVSSSESIRLESEEMIEAMEAYVASRPKFAEHFPDFNVRDPLQAPYLFWYHDRPHNAFDDLNDLHRDYMRRLTSWIEENYGETYQRVEKQLQRGFVSRESLEFLFKPGDAVLVTHKSNQDVTSYTAEIATSWPRQKSQGNQPVPDIDIVWTSMGREDDKKFNWTWKLDCWSYKYNGSFYRRSRSITLSIKADELNGEMKIHDLDAYPLQYASDEIKDALGRRGRTFWSCRNRKLVSYEDKDGKYGSAERFMVDFVTYRQLHSDTWAFKNQYNYDEPGSKKMEPSVMESDDPPAAPEIYAFPDTIVGYNLRNKKWVDLQVDHIREVVWNKLSFSHLVVDSETKELIHALVTNQIASEQGTDIIESKGNGLIILLHGGPGTGKTFTAESVAELAEKPLFRVTCGDIGTKPEEVEKYLESVLHLSKNWGCVVLLDEADVFLEERSLNDLERNALVSVFLRVLEYYEGILILTSNRVGTFDEAFKSRIQLALHYENLTKGQRQRIWKNFIQRLKEMNAAASAKDDPSVKVEKKKAEPIAIDFDDIECYYSELAEYEMNGRQIRNAITTARQLAKFKGQLMNFSHLKHVINVASKFDKYLNNVNEGFTDDQIARGEGVR